MSKTWEVSDYQGRFGDWCFIVSRLVLQQLDDFPKKSPVVVNKPKYRSKMLLLFGYAYSLLGLNIGETMLLSLYLL